ncbi:XtrA/YqaO family protein [Piscibacillus salipiscarius]|uniref:XtrA/YqaO family protein n=1 Tax=Piscibacillus salipiscarius TaxID=299480 RepID=A0ABW5Q7A3_9BACI|nr:XtrA/YqaO family protein [Piscibacillus salipiscarius]
MRLKPIPVDMKNRQILIDIEGNEPFCVVYSNGKAKITKLPSHGETKVITHQGKVKRVKFDEGEEF